MTLHQLNMNLPLTIFSLNYKRSTLLVSLLFCLFSTVTSFSQSVSVNNSSEVLLKEGEVDTNNLNVKESSQNLNSNVNFILWFMGTKEDPNKVITEDGYTKKFIMTSGTEPNHLMIKTLLKKAVNIEFC